MKDKTDYVIISLMMILIIGMVYSSVNEFVIEKNIIPKIILSTVHIQCVDGNWQGSGVIVDKERGIIITAAHVVQDAYSDNNMTDFIVTLSNGRKYKAVDVFSVPYTDVGILRIDANNLCDVEFGDSDTLYYGDTVFVCGAPFGIEQFPTLTKGIVSGLYRSKPFFGEKHVIQVDAAACPGNSGGGVFDENGKLIGILVGGFYGSDNTSICIPVDVIKAVLRVYNSNLLVELIK